MQKQIRCRRKHPGKKHPQSIEKRYGYTCCSNNQRQRSAGSASTDFLLNNRTFRKNDIPDNLPAGMMFWRDVSGWNTGTKMVCILEAIKERIDPFVESSQPIVLLDMAPAHLMPEVYAAAHRLNIWLLFIPAKTTYLLQPLDVACLSSYKCSLRKVFTENEDNNGCLQTQDWFAALTKLLRSFWRARSWKNAFGCVGLSGKTCDLSEEIRSLGLVHNTVKPLSIPKETDIEKLWPKKKKGAFQIFVLVTSKAASGRNRLTTIRSLTHTDIYINIYHIYIYKYPGKSLITLSEKVI